MHLEHHVHNQKTSSNGTLSIINAGVDLTRNNNATESDKNALPVPSHLELASNDAVVHIPTGSFTLILVSLGVARIDLNLN